MIDLDDAQFVPRIGENAAHQSLRFAPDDLDQFFDYLRGAFGQTRFVATINVEIATTRRIENVDLGRKVRAPIDQIFAEQRRRRWAVGS